MLSLLHWAEISNAKLALLASLIINEQEMKIFPYLFFYQINFFQRPLLPFYVDFSSMLPLFPLAIVAISHATYGFKCGVRAANRMPPHVADQCEPAPS